jgi:CxxC-x17-CxxC domain-containing protein
MEFQDKVLKCVDCNTDFLFTVGEQLFYHDKQFRNEPKRCKSCKTRTKRVSLIGDGFRARTAPKIETRTNCSQCGKDTTVPFRPTQGRPVLCRDCFQGSRTAASGD